MKSAHEIVFLFDVDNTLLDNDRVLDDVARRFPARHYVMVDDKLRILAAMKNVWRDRLTTVFPRQGHYALDPANIAEYPAADLTLGRIGELAGCELPVLLRGTVAAQPNG